MITPKEIEEKEFSRVVRGFKPEEVDLFLDEIILDLEQLLKEREEMRSEIKALRAEVDQHKKSESSVMDTLDSAKKLMKDISESAEKRAEIIIRNAHLDAEGITRDAKESISRLREENRTLMEQSDTLRQRYTKMLEEELARAKALGKELFADFRTAEEAAPAEESTAEGPEGAAPVDHESLEPSNRLMDRIFADYEAQVTKATGQTPKKTAEVEVVGDAKPVASRRSKRNAAFGAPKKTVVLDSKDIDALLIKEKQKRERRKK